ncbi:chorismate-binding protein [Micrococcus porci]|uniref:isochorismate synthase n=1 Tax=Micrococcus TaxID=1269 RepID=UPI001CCD02A5|nr:MULTISPECIES: chorismate-binding protein [Micrococcus]MCG7422279.1 chorismate-binding protein [Micrococcus sp. ACRRV]UBH25159.1 chorismate-binding protein [Micrococcus porci]
MPPVPSVAVAALAARALSPSGSAAGRVPAFARAVVWAREDTVRVGVGGHTVLLDGPDRLRRLSALWRAAVAARPEPASPALAWVSSAFDDASPVPSVLRVPARVLQAGPDGVVEVPVAMPREALAAAVAACPGARLTEAGEVPLPADDPALAWDDAGYAAGVEEVVARMEASAGALSKVVVSRTETVPAGEDRLWAAVDALRAEYPQTWTFAVGGLVGATPEMLATRRDGVVASRVLAGSLPRGVDEGDDARLRARLAADPRLLREHHWAARSVLDALAPVVELEDAHPAPFVLTLPNVHHLATDVRGRLRPGEGAVLDVVAALHPTAAVGGTPTAEALEVIRAVEPVDRGRYAGPVGWLDQDGDGEIALALRCGQQVPGGVRLQAGGGIVPGAAAEEEVVEVGVKLLPMRRALGVA